MARRCNLFTIGGWRQWSGTAWRNPWSSVTQESISNGPVMTTFSLDQSSPFWSYAPLLITPNENPNMLVRLPSHAGSKVSNGRLTVDWSIAVASLNSTLKSPAWP